MTDTPSVKPTPLERADEAMAAAVPALWGPGTRHAMHLAFAAALSDEDEMVRVWHRCAPPGMPGACPSPCGYLHEAREMVAALRAYLLGGES